MQEEEEAPCAQDAPWPGAMEGPRQRCGDAEEWGAIPPRPRPGLQGWRLGPAPAPALRACPRLLVLVPSTLPALTAERTAPLRRFWFSCESQMAFSASGSYI